MGYKHLTKEQRYTIMVLLQAKATISRELDIQFYFARPYHSWERGANENLNGLVRQYIPKGTDFSNITDEMLSEIEWKLNNRPRKSLGYKTPLEYCKTMFNFDFEKVAL